MIELPVLIENIIEIVNVAIEMMLVFLYFSLLSKAKVNKAVLYLSYLLSTVILSATDESVWGSWIEQPSNFDDVKKIHNAFQSLKCDYYGNSNIELYPVNNYGYKRCPALK